MTFEHNPSDEDPHGECRHEIQRLEAENAELKSQLVKEGPLNAEVWRLDELIAELEKWRSVTSGQTCVSFENLCYGASSLWHQTHRENYRAVDRRPKVLSQWMLENERCVKKDFPAQVLEVLTRFHAELAKYRTAIDKLRGVQRWRRSNAALLYERDPDGCLVFQRDLASILQELDQCQNR